MYTGMESVVQMSHVSRKYRALKLGIWTKEKPTKKIRKEGRKED